jgi:hypothetical protein
VSGADLLALYDRQMRRAAAPTLGVHVERAHGVVRLCGAYNVVLHSDLDDRSADAAIEAHVRRFGDAGERLEWKVHAHDRPADLAARLAARGFVPEPEETVMVAEAAAAARAAIPPGLRVGPVEGPAGLDDFLAVTAEVFGGWTEEFRAELAQGAAAGTAALHVAYRDGRAVGAGRLDLAPGKAFAGAFTGAVVQDHRGAGVYRALVAARAAQAVARGYRYLYAEALETSRPILARLGFSPLTTVRGWVLDPEQLP